MTPHYKEPEWEDVPVSTMYDDEAFELPKGYHRDPRTGSIRDDDYGRIITPEEIVKAEAERAHIERRRRRKRAIELFWVRLFWGTIGVLVGSMLVGTGFGLAISMGWWALGVPFAVVVGVFFLYGLGMGVQRIIAIFKAKW